MQTKTQWTRSVNDRVFMGVCGGLAQSLGLKSWLVRVIFLVAVFWFGTGCALYFILAFTLPRADKLDKALDRKVLGVCARISKGSNIEVGLVRTGFALAMLVTLGGAVLVYGLCYFVVPKSVNL